MSSLIGPQLPTNGLALHLDAANRKSFGGTGTDMVGGIVPTFGNWNGLTGTSVAYTDRQGKQGVLVRITSTGSGGGVNWWARAGSMACSSSTQYTITAIARWSVVPHENLFYVVQYNSSNGQTSQGGRFNVANKLPIGDGFYLIWATFTTDATATSFILQGYDYQINDVWIEDVQCKLGGMTDLSGNGRNGVLSGTLTFSPSSGGVAQINNSSWMNTSLNLSSSAYTVIGSSRWTGGANGRIITAASSNWLLGHWNATTENHYAEGWVTPVSSGAANDTLWRIFSASGNSGTDSWQMYVNGNLTYSNNGGATGPNVLGINSQPSERSNAEFGFLLAYNRVLTSDEIKRIFDATRSRYNL